MELDENLSPYKEMTLFPVSAFMDSVYSSVADLRSAELVLNKDSGYTFYLTGLTNFSTGAVETYRQPSIPPQSSWSSNNPVNTYLSTSTYNPLLPNSEIASMDDNNTRINYLHAQGQNFFMTLGVKRKNTFSIYNFKDSKQGYSLPEFDYVANTGKNIHYIYNRALKRNKQLVFELIFDKNGQMHLNTVVANSKYKLLINSGNQVTSNSIVFPILDNRALSFAKMDLE